MNPFESVEPPKLVEVNGDGPVGMVSPNNPNNLPSHLSERTFRVYEPALTRAVAAFPSETSFPRENFRMENGSLLSINTIVARFRDATVSLKRFRWETTVDCDKLWRITGEYMIAPDPSGTSVWFRNKQRRGRPSDLTAEARQRGAGTGAGPSTVMPPTTWQNWTEDEVRAVCLLINANRVTGPFVLRGEVSPELVNTFEQTMNVSLTFDQERNETIIL